MDDGSAGLYAIQACGGITVVQDPATAVEPEMPRNALAAVQVDHCVPLDQIVPLLTQLVRAPTIETKLAPPLPLAREAAINRGEDKMENLAAIATPSPLTCPDCGGGLWEVNQAKPLRYRCHTGHAYSAVSLARCQADAAEHALWSGVRALREREMLLRRVAGISLASGDVAQACAGEAQADRLRRQIDELSRFAQATPSPLPGEPTT